MSHYFLTSFLGYGTFFIGLIVSVILYAKKKKFFPILYLISICLYIFTVGFVIERFDFTKNQILITLAFSSLVMIALGWYLSHKIANKAQ